MTRSKRMEPVQRLANDQAEQAARQFAQRRQQLAEQQQRLGQLESFRREYQDRLHTNAKGGIDAFRLRDYNAFIGRIDQALAEQRQTVHRCEQDLERSRTQWMQELGRARAIGKVVERARSDELRLAERREQRASDELPRRRPSPVEEV